MCVALSPVQQSLAGICANTVNIVFSLLSESIGNLNCLQALLNRNNVNSHRRSVVLTLVSSVGGSNAGAVGRWF